MYASNDTQSRQNSKLSELHLERAQAEATGMGNGNGDWGLGTGDWSGLDSRQQAIIDRTDMNKDNGRVAILHFCIRNENK